MRFSLASMAAHKLYVTHRDWPNSISLKVKSDLPYEIPDLSRAHTSYSVRTALPLESTENQDGKSPDLFRASSEELSYTHVGG